MIHARQDYQRIQDPDNKIPMNEPVFLLRGQDILAPEVIAFWNMLYKRRGGDPNVVKLVEAHIEKIEEYQKINPIKLADIPVKTEPDLIEKVPIHHMRRHNRVFSFPSELVIREAIVEVENLKADPRLTQAQYLLSKALEIVADVMDDDLASWGFDPNYNHQGAN